MKFFRAALLILLTMSILSGCAKSKTTTDSPDNNASGHDSESPSVPLNLSADQPDATTIGLTWNESTDNVAVTGYRIYRNDSLAGSTASLTYTDTEPVSGTTSYYSVSAFDAAGNESEHSESLPVISGTSSVSPLVTLSVKEFSGTDRSSENVRSGVPFPKGVLSADDHLILSDGAAVLPLQTRPLSQWDDGSIRWLLLDTRLSIDAGSTKELGLIKSQFQGTISSPVAVSETSQLITINTGALTVEIPKTNGGLIHRLWAGPTLVIDAPEDNDNDRGPWISTGGDTYYGLLLNNNASILQADPVSEYKAYVNGEGGGFNLYDPWDLSVTIEEAGPLHVVVRVSGAHLDESGMGFSSFVTRIHAFANSSQLKIDHTLIFTGTGNDEISGYGIKMPFAGTQTNIEGEPVATGSLLQTAYDDYSIAGSNRTGQAKGYVVRTNDSASFGVVLKDMAENYPKAIVATTDGIDVQLYPESLADLNVERYLDAIDGANGESASITKNRSAQGFSKTDTMVFDFNDGGATTQQLVQLADQLNAAPLMTLAQPDWYSDAKVMGVGDFVFNTTSANSEQLYRIDRKLKVVADFMRYNQREKFDWFGMMDYGDIRGLFSGGCNTDIDDCQWSEEGRYGWSGNSGEPSNQLWIQFLRTLDPDVLVDAIALAKHTQDVQMIHYGDAVRLGDQSIAGGRNREFSVGSLHRHGKQAWSGYGQAPEYSHMAGVETYYYLTGSGRAKESLYEAAAFIERYGTNFPEYTALVNGVDTLSRASAVFYDTPEIYNLFNDRNTLLLNYLSPAIVTSTLSGAGDLEDTFSYFIRGACGLLYHHERTENAKVADMIFAAADYTAGGDDRWGIGDDAETGGLWYYLNTLTYAASIAAEYSKPSTHYTDLIDKVIKQNAHNPTDSGQYSISLESFNAVPDDWTKWVWEWHEGELTPDAPELLYIARQMTYRNNAMQDYHSYRAFIHLAAAAALSENM